MERLEDPGQEPGFVTLAESHSESFIKWKYEYLSNNIC